MKNKIFYCCLMMSLTVVALSSCSSGKKLSTLANKTLLQRPEVATAHVGISITDANSGRSLYNYQGDKYFIPASNTKLLTCYAAMKYLGDSIEALRYAVLPVQTTKMGQQAVVWLTPAGDPTFLHPDFPYQPVASFLKRDTTTTYLLAADNWRTTAWGSGWAWSDYEDAYMADRSAFPLYGNVLRIRQTATSFSIQPSAFTWQYNGRESNTPTLLPIAGNYVFNRDKNTNTFYWKPRTGVNAGLEAKHPDIRQDIPFMTSLPTSLQLLRDTLPGLKIELAAHTAPPGLVQHIIYSQPVDTMLRIMMHRSDNFLAEQSLLLVSHKLSQQLNDAAVIDTLLSSDYAAMPQSPRWVDGSGLSRYNLLSPQDFTWLLQKMKNDFSWQRITGILETGGEGTLSNYYKQYTGRIYAKTGTLSNNVSLSGYLLTRKGNILAFSVLVNNHKAAVGAIRKEVEAFLGGIIERM